MAQPMTRARTGWADPVLLAMLVAAVLLVPWFLLGPVGPGSSWVLQTTIDLLNVRFAMRLHGLGRTGRAARRFWLAIAAGAGSCAAGDAYQTGLVLTGAGGGPSMVQTCLVIAGMVIVVGTMLCHPLGGTGRQRLRLWLDAGTVVVAVTVFLWYYMFAGQFGGGEGADRLGTAVSATTMLLVTFALVKLIFSETAPFHRGAGIVGALGVAGTALVAPLAPMLADRFDPGVLLLAQVLPCLLVPVSLRLQEVQTRRRGGRRAAGSRRGFSRLPYAAVAATQILLVAALPATAPDVRIWGVAVGVVVITGLVLVRQVAAFHDNERLLTERDESMRRLSEQKEWFSALVQHASDLTVVTGGDPEMVAYTSPAAKRFLGTELTGDALSEMAHPDDLPVLRALTDRLAAAPGTSAGAEIRLRDADGTYRWLHLVGTDLRANPAVGGIVWNGRDVTEARRLQDELWHQATHDALTGLANRALLQQRVQAAAPDARIAVLLLDLNGFKQVNDVHGHHAGDQVLVAVANRVGALLGPAGTLARLGGDEFAVLLPGAGRAEAVEAAELVAAAVAEPIAVTGAVVSVGTSVGIAVGTAADADRLLRDADAAMYRDKQSHRTPA